MGFLTRWSRAASQITIISALVSGRLAAHPAVCGSKHASWSHQQAHLHRGLETCLKERRGKEKKAIKLQGAHRTKSSHLRPVVLIWLINKVRARMCVRAPKTLRCSGPNVQTSLSAKEGRGKGGRGRGPPKEGGKKNNLRVACCHATFTGAPRGNGGRRLLLAPPSSFGPVKKSAELRHVGCAHMHTHTCIRNTDDNLRRRLAPLVAKRR